MGTVKKSCQAPGGSTALMLLSPCSVVNGARTKFNFGSGSTQTQLGELTVLPQISLLPLPATSAQRDGPTSKGREERERREKRIKRELKRWEGGIGKRGGKGIEVRGRLFHYSLLAEA